MANEDIFPSNKANEGRKSPYAWISWKDTRVDMEVYCVCGKEMSFEGSHAYHIKCPYCDQVYHCSGYIDLMPLDKEPLNTHLIEKTEEDIIEELQKSWGEVR